MPRQAPTVTRRGLLAAATGLLAAGQIRRAAAARGRTVDAHLEARSAVVDIDGQPVQLLTYNGSFPGPILRAAEGDLLRVLLVNGLDEPTNLHFHGLHVSPAANSDNVFVEVPPGGEFRYELVVPSGFGGTFWYHPHMHHRLARQLWRGLAGPLIIDRPIDTEPGLAAADEQIVVVKDLALLDGEPSPHTNSDWARGKSGPLVLANGMPEPTLNVARSLVRLRLINACNARMLLLARGDGRPLQVLAYDGHLLAEPEQLAEVLVSPAQRVDLLLELTAGEEVALVYRPYASGARREPWRTETLLTLRPPDTESPSTMLGRLPPVERLDPAAASNRRSFKMAMAFMVPDGHGHMEPIRGRLGTLELWEITNVDTQDHVFHLHTWPFQVWRRDGAEPALPAWRDTIDLRPGERVELLVPFRDFAGKSLYHCHIAEHGDAGMMAIVEVAA